MRNTIRLLSLVLIVSLSGCFSLHEAKIESDYSYSGNFRRYRTYDFMQGPGLAADSSHLGRVLREAIQTRLGQQGYRPSHERPDLLVNFRLFEGSLRLRGYNQEALERWVKQVGDRDVEEDFQNPNRYRPSYSPVNLQLNDGTLLVTLVDARSQRAVWNGYASGVEVPNGALGEIVLRRSVRSIFDRYRVFTEGYLAPADEASEMP